VAPDGCDGGAVGVHLRQHLKASGEMVLAVWLLVKGFSPSALQWRASSADSTAVTRDVTTAKKSQLGRVET